MPAPDTRPLVERIAEKTFVGVEHVAGLGPCWEWDGAHAKAGYARMRLRNPRRAVEVHRLVFILEHGEMAPGIHVDHRCHNRGCVRGSHLRALTPAQNGQNRAGATSVSSTGVRNVFPDRRRGGFVVSVKKDGVAHYGGSWPSVESAERAAIALRQSIGMTS